MGTRRKSIRRRPPPPIRLLVSACNRDGGLWTVGFEPQSGRCRTRRILDRPTTGIAITPTRILVGHESGVLGFSRSLKPMRSYTLNLPERDIHDVRPGPGDTLLVVETALNRVACYGPDLTLRSSWTPTREGTDECHLNSIDWIRRSNGIEFYISMYDREGRGGPWSARPNGVIVRIPEVSPECRGEAIHSAIRQPHSLVVHNEALWWCESDRARVVREGAPVLSAHGYVRGLAFHRGWMFVGTSLTGDHLRAGSRAAEPPTAAVIAVQGEQRFTLPIPSREIYDIAIIS